MHARLFICALLAAAAAAPASAATIIIYTDPMTMERRTVVVESGGREPRFPVHASTGRFRLPGSAGTARATLGDRFQ